MAQPYLKTPKDLLPKEQSTGAAASASIGRALLGKDGPLDEKNPPVFRPMSKEDRRWWNLVWAIVAGVLIAEVIGAVIFWIAYLLFVVAVRSPVH